jgi:ribonucleoside-diphosphate reductase beta chain
MKEITVFNKNTTAHKTGNYPLIFGEDRALYDGINKPYPKLYDLMEKLKQLDWSPDDVDLQQTRMDLLNCGENTRNIMLYNLAYQWELDSIATNISALLAPFISNTEYNHLILRITENEALHSDTYSNIVRQCIPNPQEVFDMVYKNDQVLGRAETVSRVLSDLKRVGAEYTLGLISADNAKPFVIKGIVTIYALERISFMSSFACTYSLAEQELFVGAARLIQKINMDELIHIEAGRYVLTEILNKDGEFSKVIQDNIEDIEQVVQEIVQREFTWNAYLFSEGRNIVGLNETLLNDWTKYNAQEVFDNLGLEQPYRKVSKDPLPWIAEDWLDLNSQQNANMESDATNYQVSSVSSDVPKDLDLDFTL